MDRRNLSLLRPNRRASISLRIWKPMDDTLPLDFRLLEIDEKTDGPAGGSQIGDTLRGVLAGQPFHTFQLDHQHVFNEQIGKVLSERITLRSEERRVGQECRS